MPLSITSFSKRKNLPFVYDGETVTLSFNPMRYTPAFEEEIEEMSGTNFQSKALVRMIEQLEFEWEGIVDGDGNPFPATHDNLMSLPVEFLAAMIATMQEAASPDESEGKA